MIAATRPPGLRFEVAPPASAPTALRSDVAGFIGRARRGAPGAPIRVEGWRAYQAVFGGLAAHAATSYAVRGYFANGGLTAHVTRLVGPAATTAKGKWSIGAGADPAYPHGGRFRHTGWLVEAADPGEWANGARVSFEYRLRGADETPEVRVAVHAPDEPVERIAGLDPADAESFEDRLNAVSRLIRIMPDPQAPPAPNPVGQPPGPARLRWEIALAGGAEGAPEPADYADAVVALDQVGEVALVNLPDLYADLADPAGVIALAASGCETTHDRLLLLDAPPDAGGAAELIAWRRDLRSKILDDPRLHRAVAVYHPPVRVPDPLGGLDAPLRTLAPGGHVAGLISRFDRERGAHHTPANAALEEVVDVESHFSEPEQGLLNAAGVNLLRCAHGRGVLVWGGRTVDRDAGRFVAHRRLIHRLVRALRGTGETLVFENNGPALWQALSAAAVAVLLAAWRAGALKGDNPDQAFRVQCDAETNPPAERDLGRVFCLVQVAPAAPMEFITLRIALAREGALEVFES